MKTEAFERSLKKVGLLASLEAGLTEEFETRAEWQTWVKGQTIIEQGEKEQYVYFLTKGTARVVLYSPQGKIVAFREIQSGELIGEFSALDGKPRSATVEALESCITAGISSAEFWALIECNPQFARSLILTFVGRLRELTDRVYEFSALAVNNRIHVELMRLASKSNDNVAIIGSAPTHAEMALRISSHREAVSREMSRLQRMGLVVRKENAIVIPDTEKFSRLIDADDPELVIGS